jgi:hypothetical protein
MGVLPASGREWLATDARPVGPAEPYPVAFSDALQRDHVTLRAEMEASQLRVE